MGLEESLKDYKDEIDDLKVQLARQGAALAAQQAQGGKQVVQKDMESLDFGFSKGSSTHEDESDEIMEHDGVVEFNKDDYGGIEAADVELRLDRNFDDIKTGPEREKFKELFIADVARALGVAPETIQVTGFAKGSIVVKFTILPTRPKEDGEGPVAPTPMELARLLEIQLAQDNSQLKDGIVTVSTPPHPTPPRTPWHPASTLQPRNPLEHAQPLEVPYRHTPRMRRDKGC